MDFSDSPLGTFLNNIIPVPMKYDYNAVTQADVENRFTYHAPKDDQVQRFTALRQQAHDLAEAILTDTPPSREQALALTKLEECVMWANAAIARHE